MAGLRARKKEQVHATIQREALRLFTERGFDETTIEQITEAAGVSPATFYRCFKSGRRARTDGSSNFQYDSGCHIWRLPWW
jgi:AcrR family transcriptional regulator